MGFFDLFKRHKSKEWKLPERSDNSFIQAVSFSLAKVTLGDKLIVKKDWMAVLVAKDKALDIFGEGEHTLNLGIMPHATKLLKLDIGKKKKRRGTIVVELAKDFLCDIYFVNLKMFENRIWKTEAIKFKLQKQVTKFWMQGRYDVQVRNAHDVIELFLIDWGFIRSDMALGKIDFLVSEFLTEEITKIKNMTPDEIAKKDIFENLLKPKIEKKFEKYGLKFFNVGVESIVYSKSVEVAPLLEAKKEVENTKEVQEEKPEEQVIIGKLDDADSDEKSTKTEKQLVLVGKKSKKANVNETEDNAEKTSIFDIDAEEPKLSGRRKQNLKLCPKCGEILKAGSLQCEKCGYDNADKIPKKGEKQPIICPECGKENKQGTIFCDCDCYLPPKDI